MLGRKFPLWMRRAKECGGGCTGAFCTSLCAREDFFNVPHAPDQLLGRNPPSGNRPSKWIGHASLSHALRAREDSRYWGTDYDRRNAEARLNALLQFATTIDGGTFSLHVRSPILTPCRSS